MKFSKKIFLLFRIISFSLVMFLVNIALYFVLQQLSMKHFWTVLPVILYMLLIFTGKYIKRLKFISVSLEFDSILSYFFLFIVIQKVWLITWVKNNFDILAFIIIWMFFINLACFRLATKEKGAEDKTNSPSLQLFNLFYLNTSKAHEIAMLIDNKIMKTIEREQVSEELLKYSTSGNLGRKESTSLDMGYAFEDSTKKRVYENFDVKTTKSIMLRTIYKTAQQIEKNIQNIKIGDLIVFKNIELQQTNIDDTVMILNVLQDSKFKNQTNQDLEINFSKMMDKMLDDFTIDYTFSLQQEDGKVETFIIQIPYKANENFENGYQHNDLQLGKLSLIGIYRGKIDFSKRESISSKFLELITYSYNQESKKTQDIKEMKLSSSDNHVNNILFNFNHKKLNEEMHLVDVIAIIQELNFNRDE